MSGMGGDSRLDKVANLDNQEAILADTAGSFLTCSQILPKGLSPVLLGTRYREVALGSLAIA